MAQQTHTPGPWTVNSLTRIEGPAYGLIASVRGSLDKERTHANARLIAAAPDMLNTLRDVLEILQDSWGDEQLAAGDDQAANLIMAQLARIEGRTT